MKVAISAGKRPAPMAGIGRELGVFEALVVCCMGGVEWMEGRGGYAR